ncbi:MULTISPECIES: CBS domain-containing protein [Streptomyces]|uniref:CBS domain-containing protein n=1 Tax=Streptomyces atratus TaxID=1893 RepID=A0A1K2FA61_STRAR|nr:MULTISPECIES: CBS domain-containing protein [Streptomyces]WTB51791.1 CBS domain-containing protein [Streptomyces sp. NBC_00826]WTH95317.1 CBS domain-containing protein [Streptomyces sp. NBC_00825]WTI04051.1 CBS domain-containing protein [Streptomyces sp. NBC_00822]MCX4869649.1 CBS domain-containing protein [Streptomyces sp. NBC_00906]MCX4902221.1 CBS domain-containing protein [Streptomyces sp. NBC_00892]
MTLVQMQPRSASATPVHRTAVDAMGTGAPQVCDDMTVEVALSVMASARTGYLLVCDNDGLCTQLVTQAQLAAVRDSPAYTDRVQLRDILGDRGPFTSPVTSMAEAEHAMRCRLDALPVVDEQGSALGVLAPAG